jgi:hypothetical protein
LKTVNQKKMTSAPLVYLTSHYKGTKMSLHKIFQISIFLLLALSGGAALAGNLVGKGGMLVSCTLPDPDESQKYYELLDFFELRQQRKMIGEDLINSAGITEKEIVIKVIRKLSRVDRIRASRYRYWLEKFSREVSFVDNSLPRTMDAGLTLELPNECELVQAVVQVAPEHEGDPRYFVDSAIWSALPTLQRAGLILHEFVIRDAKDQGVETTEGIRRFIGFLFSNDIEMVSEQGYQEQLKASELSASSLSAPVINCKNVISGILANQVIKSEFKGQKRNFGTEEADGARELQSYDLRISGGELALPMLVKTRGVVYSVAGDGSASRRVLRLQESTKGLVLRIFQRRASDILFANIEPYESNGALSQSGTISGTVTCSPDGVRFIGEDVGVVDYQIGTGQFVLAKSSYSIEWSRVDDVLGEAAVVTTFSVDPVTLEKKAVIGTGWHD